MKIAMVSEHGSPLSVLGSVATRGRNVHLAELSAALTRRGHTVTVYTRREDAKLPERVEMPQGYTVVHVPAGPAKPLAKDERLNHIGQFARLLDTQWTADRPDVAHAHFWMSGVAAQLAARHLDLPAVQTFHALGVVERGHQGADCTIPRERQHLEAMIARCADWVAATCAEEVFEVIRMGRPRARMSIVPCGVDVNMFTPTGPTAPRGERHRVLCVGKLAPRKGFDVVIQAMQAVPDAELVIVGGPDKSELHAHPEARRLLELAEKLGVADRVQLYGSVARERMPAILRSADVVACTPWYEPFGIVPLEAMASGIPVVASAVGGMLDTVVHDVTGWLVKPRSHTEVARAIKHLLRDDFLRQSLGAAGRDRATTRYTWDRIAADTLRIYGRLVPAGLPAQPVDLSSR